MGTPLWWFRDKGKLKLPLLPVSPGDARKKGDKFFPKSAPRAFPLPLLSHPTSTLSTQPYGMCICAGVSVIVSCLLTPDATRVYLS